MDRHPVDKGRGVSILPAEHIAFNGATLDAPLLPLFQQTPDTTVQVILNISLFPPHTYLFPTSELFPPFNYVRESARTHRVNTDFVSEKDGRLAHSGCATRGE